MQLSGMRRFYKTEKISRNAIGSRRVHAGNLFEQVDCYRKSAHTCGELIAALNQAGAPQIEVVEIDRYIHTRGRRSNRSI